jgi:hypothetical protein
MNQNVIYVHDPYDVFLAVGFGFCYGSALLPVVRLLEKYKLKGAGGPGTTISSTLPLQSTTALWGSRFVQLAVILRGVLTIVGLACLYGWYSLYLNRSYGHAIPAYRIFLDWISLGLFATGANFWDNEDHRENLYCLVQGLATLTFCWTCVLAIHETQLEVSKPLFKAVFWCVVIMSCFVIDIIISWCAGKVLGSSAAS